MKRHGDKINVFVIGKLNYQPYGAALSKTTETLAILDDLEWPLQYPPSSGHVIMCFVLDAGPLIFPCGIRLNINMGWRERERERERERFYNLNIYKIDSYILLAI